MSMPRGRKRKEMLDNFVEGEPMDETMDTLPNTEPEEAPPTTEEQPMVTKTEPKEEAEEPTTEATTTEGQVGGEPEEEGEILPENNTCPPKEVLDTLVPEAKEGLAQLDVLVCGKCHYACYFIPQLTEHKTVCTGTSDVISPSTKSDNKPQVWAFVLYKAFKIREEMTGGGEMTDKSWQLYQKWSGLETQLKNTWIEAGRVLMGLQQTPGIINTALKRRPTPANTATSTPEQQRQTLMQLQKELEDDPEPAPPTAAPRGRPAKKVKHEDHDDLETHISPHTIQRGEMRKRAGNNQVWRKILKEGENESETELYTVEKIVAKRANPRLKSAEYLVKWQGIPSDQNSWEHASNLLTCKPIIEEFERNLAKQKARKAAEAQRAAQAKGVVSPQSSRPMRSSALRAMDQVKEWVSNKRLPELEDEDVKPAKTVLMANSKGMMKMDQNQMANLSSGVYIISDTSGYVKVDDHAALSLSSLTDTDGHSLNAMMINETEVRKVPGKGIRREGSAIIRKENLGVNRRPLPTSAPRPAGRQLILGQQRQRPLPGPVNSPLRPPKPKNSFNNVARPQKTILGRGMQQQRVLRVVDEDDSLLTNDVNICPVTGNVLGDDSMAGEGEEMTVTDADGMMRVAISPGGSLTQHILQEQEEEHEGQPQELLEFQGEDGVIYQLTPEQQQMFLQDGTITMDAKQEPLDEHEEMVIENGQIVRRVVSSNETDEAEDGTFMLAEDGLEGVKLQQMVEGEDGEAVLMQGTGEEALQGARVQLTTEDGTVDAQLLSADALEPGATTRKVLLQLLDGTLLSTDLDEEQFQALGVGIK